MTKDAVASKDILRLNINWAAVLAFVTFWCYGFYGGLSSGRMGILANIAISIILYGLFLLFIFLWYRRPEFNDTFIITREDAAAFISYLIIMFIFSFRELVNPLQGDQLFHAQYSQLHATHLIFGLSKITAIFDNMAFSKVLYAVNLLTLFIVAAVCYIIRKKSFILRAALLSIAFISFRAVVIKLGGYPDEHPPLRFLPLWLSSSVLSVHNISFRLPQFLGLICLMWISQRAARDKLSRAQSWMFGLAIGTIPVLWHTGILVELSIWTAVVWAIMLLAISKDGEMDDFNWIRWFSLISLCTLMRQSAFVGLVPLSFLFVIYSMKHGKLKAGTLLLLLASAVCMFPFLMKSIMFGTPATYIPGEVEFISKDASGIQRVLLAVTSGAAPRIIYDSVTLPWIIFAPFAFIPLYYDNNKLLKGAAAFVFFIAAFFIFYSISPKLWGLGRYQAEYVIPFAILGFFHVLTRIDGIIKGISGLIIVVMACLLIYNVTVFKNLYAFNKRQIISETPYSYDEALRAARAEGYAGSLLVGGITYGVFQEIINGYTVSQVYSDRDIFKKVMKSWDAIDYKALNNDQRIRMVLVAELLDSDKKELLSYLLSSGWGRWKDFKNYRSGSVIYGFVR